MEMLSLLAEGFLHKTVVVKIAKKYDVTPLAIYKDWERRKTWIWQISGVTDPTLILELIAGMRKVNSKAWHEYRTTPNPSVKLGALKLINKSYKELISLLLDHIYVKAEVLKSIQNSEDDQESCDKIFCEMSEDEIRNLISNLSEEKETN
jgi:hypothetical protein